VKAHHVAWTAAVAIVLGYVALGFLGSREESLAQFWTNAGGPAGAAALATLLTGVLVALYLYETNRLRQAAEQEYAPFLGLTFDPGLGLKQPNVYLRNLGRGPATNVDIVGLNIPGLTGLEDKKIRLRFAMVSPSVALPLIKWGPSDGHELLDTDFVGQVVEIRYSDPAGRQYAAAKWIGDPAWDGAFRSAPPE
jgi:hypothetical protein